MASWLPHLPTPGMVRAGGETLLVRRLGRGPRMVLLHGGPGLDHHLLLPLAAALADRFEIWLPDLPGHGGTGGRVLGLRHTLERLWRFLGEVEPVVLGGHSFGAFLARELVRGRMARPQALLLLCPPGPLRGRDARRVLPAALRGDSEQELREALLEEVGQSRPLLQEVREAAEATVLQSPTRFARLVGELLPLVRGSVPPCDPRCPTLILAGELDRVAPPAAARAVTIATRGAELQVLPRAGHFPWAEEVALAADPIRRFLAERLP